MRRNIKKGRRKPLTPRGDQECRQVDRTPDGDAFIGRVPTGLKGCILMQIHQPFDRRKA